MALSPIPILHVGGFKTGAKNVGLSSSSFLGGRRARLVCSSPLLLKISGGFRVGASNLSSSSQAEDERIKEDGGASFLKMWERAKQGKSVEDEQQDWARKEKDFQSMLQIPKEDRDRVQRIQVVDRAAAALAAVNALLADSPNSGPQQKNRSPALKGASAASRDSTSAPSPKWIPTSVVDVRPQQLSRPRETAAAENGSPSSARSGFQGPPGPDFWSWVPPDHDGGLQPLKSAVPDPKPTPHLLEKDRTPSSLSIPFETAATEETVDLPIIFQNRAMPSLPPLQSLLEVDKEKELTTEAQPSIRMPSIDTQTASAVNQDLHRAESLSSGVSEDGSRWWRETGVQYRENGVTCKWTTVRGVSADEATEWQENFWEAFDAFDYKELGAQKSGRDSFGRVWHEFWRESMWQDAVNGLQHMEKTADKWGKDSAGGEWREKWFEHYDASGYTEKWADKWSKINSDTPLEPGHAHTWRERWGESYDGQGGAMKYTDKWAERKEFGKSWTKWGDKWDEHFDHQGHGVKQGETWWEGINREKWNRTWGEGHNGTGWVHKYGRSSSGEHWDTHTEEATWYERKPHSGFRECFGNSQELRRVNEQRKRQL